MIEIAAVVSMLLYGPMAFTLTREPITFDVAYEQSTSDYLRSGYQFGGDDGRD